MKTPPFHSLRACLNASAVAAALLLAACGGSSSDNATPAKSSAAPAPAAAQKLHLVYITKGQQDVFWKSVEKGLRAAEKDANAQGTAVEVKWDAPIKDGDREAQVSMVESYVSQKPDGIILCPVDDQALVGPAEKAHTAGIPLIIADSPLAYKETVSFVGTDNFRGGQLAGEELARVLNGKGNVLLLRYMQGSASCEQRENGFLDAIKKHPDLKIISDDNYAGSGVDQAMNKSQDLLNTFSGKLDGVFTPNESSTNGMLLALDSAGLTGKIKFVGFDGGTANMDGLKAGKINALVLQNPYKMGYLGVMTMLDHIAGKPVPDNVDTVATLVTKDNLDSAPVVELLANTVSQ